MRARRRRSWSTSCLHTCGGGCRATDAEIVNDVPVMAGPATARVKVAFEIHVDCWTEKYKRVTPIVQQAGRAAGFFRLNRRLQPRDLQRWTTERGRSPVREDVETDAWCSIRSNREPLREWLAVKVVDLAQFGPVVTNNPPNIWGKHPDGSQPRGIMYPMAKPAPGEWHAPWHPWKLEACKEGLRHAMRYHLTHASSPLRYVITEIISQPDYAMGAKFSLVDQNAACARWIRAQWSQLKAWRRNPLRV